MTSGEWEAQRAAQTLTHFPDDELAMMSRYYNWVASFQDWVNGEGAAWSDLSVLRNPSADFGSADIIRLQGRLAAAQRFNGLIQLNSRRVLKLADDLGVPRKAADPMRLRLYCNSNEEEYFETIRKMEP